jgi:glycosyltransferase involved in cell wall biosynthesis
VRVAFLSPVFWPEVRRGTERVVHELTTELLARGHHPRLITSTRQRPSTTIEDGLPITRVPRLPAGRLTRRRFEDHLTHLPFAYAALNRGDDDVANAVYVTDALVAGRWSRRTGRPAVFSYMGIPDRAGLTARRRRVELTLAATESAAATVVLSRAARDAFARWLGVEAEIIPPTVDVYTFTPDPAARADRPTIVCGADLAAPRKRVPLLVEAFAIVRRTRPEARLILSRPRDPATAVPDGPGIELRDLDDRAALAAVYREAWVSALPSTGEAFGLVLAEALACGTPVVATNEGGMREVVDSRDIGRLFDGDDPGALATALEETLEIATDPATPGKARARAEEFSSQRCCDAYVDLYTRLRSR